jgi:hypothetical protein
MGVHTLQCTSDERASEFRDCADPLACNRQADGLKHPLASAFAEGCRIQPGPWRHALCIKHNH